MATTQLAAVEAEPALLQVLALPSSRGLLVPEAVFNLNLNFNRTVKTKGC